MCRWKWALQKYYIRTCSHCAIRPAIHHPSPCSVLIYSAPLTCFILTERDLFSVQVDDKEIGFWVTHGWQSLTKSWSVVPGWRPRMYKFVLLSCSAPLVLLPLPMVVALLLLLGLGGAIWWLEDTYGCCGTNGGYGQISQLYMKTDLWN